MKEVAFVSEKIIKTIKRENAYAVSKNPQQLEIIILHPSSFIILHSSFLHFAAFKLFSLFKKRGIGPTVCFFFKASLIHYFKPPLKGFSLG